MKLEDLDNASGFLNFSFRHSQETYINSSDIRKLNSNLTLSMNPLKQLSSTLIRNVFIRFGNETCKNDQQNDKSNKP